MALIKFGSLVTAGSGKLGGHCVQRSRGGVQLKTNAFNRMAPSDQQFWIRSINKQLASAWRSLTISQQSIWNNYAASNPSSVTKGSTVHMSGQNCFYSKNFIYLFYSLPVCLDPFACLSEPLGPELLFDTDFSTGSPWVYNGAFQWSPGKMFFDSSVSGGLRQPCSIVAGSTYRIQINIVSTVNDNRFAFANQLGQDVFPAPLNDYSPQPAGVNIHVLTAVGNSDIFYIYADSYGSPFTLTFVSLKKLI